MCSFSYDDVSSKLFIVPRSFRIIHGSFTRTEGFMLMLASRDISRDLHARSEKLLNLHDFESQRATLQTWPTQTFPTFKNGGKISKFH